MYTNIMIYIRVYDNESNAFSIKMGLHQGSELSQHIFTLAIDEITKGI
jgi:hypothetical protein